MNAAVASHSDEKGGPPGLRLMIAAATAALAIWIATGAFGWRGYPAEHAGGRLIAAVLGTLCLVILAMIARMAIAPQRTSRRAMIVAIVCWSVARLVTTSLFPLGSDEAYHWLWAKHLDLCYYDHPGMIAWLARLFAPFGSEATAWVRLCPVILGAALPAATAYLARITLRDGAVAERAALFFVLTPILSGSTFLMPALPVIFFWTLSAIQFWRAVESGRARDWLLLGLAFGGALNCNFTTFLFPLCVLAYLLVSRPHRAVLLKPGPYIALTVAAVCFLPVLVWNSQHEWRTFGFNFLRRHRDFSFHADQVALFFGQLLLYLSPVLAIAGIIGLFKALRFSFRVSNSESPPVAGSRYLAVMGLTPILAFFLTSAALKARSHYAAPAFIPLLIVFAWAAQHGALARWRRPAAILGLLFTMVFWSGLLLPALVPAPTMHGLFAKLGNKEPDKPTAELFGWPALGKYLDSSGERMDAQSQTVVIALSYAQASLAMHYSRNLDYAFSLDEGRSPYGQQFEHWGPLKDIPIGCDAILFRAGQISDEAGYRIELEKHFQRVERVNTRRKFLAELYYFSIWRGYGYRGGYGR